MTKAEIKKEYTRLRKIRDKVCILAEDADVVADKAKRQADHYEKIMESINLTLDAMEDLF